MSYISEKGFAGKVMNEAYGENYDRFHTSDLVVIIPFKKTNKQIQDELTKQELDLKLKKIAGIKGHSRRQQLINKANCCVLNAEYFALLKEVS